MKIMLAYPPLSNEKGWPTLGQNRQFQYFKAPTYIYPVVPACAATLLKKAGYEVVWFDSIAESASPERFFNEVEREKPGVIAFETKTPVIKQHWKIIKVLKDIAKDKWDITTVLFGDHVSALPEESFANCPVDFVLTGGDYDFLLLNLCAFLKNRGNALRLKDASALEPGIYYRGASGIKNTGKFELNHDLNTLPFIDRELTKWQNYAYKNGNYKRTPGAYIMSGRDCWYHACTFCSWPTLYPKFRVRNHDNVLDEIGLLIREQKVREIMDDTGCFPVGDWLRQFCGAAVKRGFHKDIYFDCNMRFGALTANDFTLMKKANFRLLLFGLESANQKTLDRLNKGLNAERIVEDCKMATKAGLFPHITIMFGYPWETYEEALKTLTLGTWLLKKGYAYTMQATMVIPYPGTALFEEAKRQGLLRSFDWEDYDMKQPVMKTAISDERVRGLVQGMYKVSFQPEFLIRKFFSVKDKDDLSYYLRAIRKVFGHIFDFSLSRPKARRP